MGDAWDGRPQNPERDGWHWVLWKEYGEGMEFTAFWSSGAWDDAYAHLTSQCQRYTYLGPCLLPAEVSAREAAAAAAMREAAASRARGWSINHSPKRLGADIAALPLPGGDALAEALAKARREGIEAAAKAVAGRIATVEEVNSRWDEGFLDGAEECAAALRALLEDAR